MKQRFQLLSRRSAKIDALFGDSFAIMLRSIVCCSKNVLVRGGMSIGERMAVIRGKKMMRDAFVVEVKEERKCQVHWQKRVLKW